MAAKGQKLALSHFAYSSMNCKHGFSHAQCPILRAFLVTYTSSNVNKHIFHTLTALYTYCSLGGRGARLGVKFFAFRSLASRERFVREITFLLLIRDSSGEFHCNKAVNRSEIIHNQSRPASITACCIQSLYLKLFLCTHSHIHL